MKNLLSLWPYFRKNHYKILFMTIAGLFCLLIVDGLQLIIPLIIKTAVDEMTQLSATFSSLLRFGLTIVGIGFLIAIFRFGWRLFLIGGSYRIEEALRDHLFSHLIHLGPNFYQRIKVGDIMARAVNDIGSVRLATSLGLIALADSIVMGTATIFLLFHIDKRLAIISLLPFSFLLLFTNQFSKAIHKKFREVQETFSILSERVRESFAGIRVVKSFIIEKERKKKTEKISINYMKQNIKLMQLWGLFFPLTMFFTNLGLGIVLLWGGKSTILGEITAGDFVAFMNYLIMLTWPMLAIGWVINLLQRGAASIRRINQILKEPPEIVDYPKIKKIEKIKGKVEIKDLNFSYQKDGPLVLKNISISINLGSLIGITGKIGSGKTTLCHLIPRWFEPPYNAIFIDDTEIHYIPLRVLRSHIGYVPQEIFLFSETIRENIKFGKPSASDEEMIIASKISSIYDEIKEFPDGFDTLVGEKGVTLSTGQRQRIAIARAILLNPTILILDDALSSVDIKTEKKIISELIKIRRGKTTTIIVSYRISSIMDADCIYVMDEGKIIEEGKHDKLIQNDGLYKRLFITQELEKDVMI